MAAASIALPEQEASSPARDEARGVAGRDSHREGEDPHISAEAGAAQVRLVLGAILREERMEECTARGSWLDAEPGIAARRAGRPERPPKKSRSPSDATFGIFSD